MSRRSSLGLALATFGAMAFFAQAGLAETIIDEWSSVKIPSAPQLKKVKADPKTTVFLVLDLLNSSCNDKRRPRCVASLPKIAKFLGAAREHKMAIIYSLTPGKTTKDVVSSVAPLASEPTVSFRADKFINTDLDKMLKEKGAKNLIIVGTTAEGAVLYTASHAAFLGYNVIVPVDGASAGTKFGEVAALWTLANAPGVGDKTTLTSLDMIEW
jgi:nicotinamidase-related amidase